MGIGPDGFRLPGIPKLQGVVCQNDKISKECCFFTLITPLSSPVEKRFGIRCLMRLTAALQGTFQSTLCHNSSISDSLMHAGTTFQYYTCSSVYGTTHPFIVSLICTKSAQRSTYCSALALPVAHNLLPSGLIAKPRHDFLVGFNWNFES